MDGNGKKQTNIINDLQIQCEILQHANAELEESRNLYASTFDHSPVGHILLSDKGIVMDANLTMASLVDIPVENLIGLPLHLLIAKEETTLFFDHLRRCKTSKTPVSTELVIITRSRHTHYVQVVSIPITLPYQQKLSYNTTIIDIHHQKHLEKKIQKFKSLNFIGEMAAGIAHEIRNPMTTVYGYLQLFKRKSASYQETKDLQIMLDELERANTIITEFLALSKNQRTELLLKNVNNMILAVYPILQAKALLTNKEIFLELFPHLPDIVMDKKQIRQVLLNLVTNALQSMDQGQVSIRTFIEDGKVVLAVEDQGHGIPLEMQEQIYSPFFTTKEKVAGLGLSICYSILERHHATLDFKTSPYGTTFFVRFPYTKLLQQ